MIPVDVKNRMIWERSLRVLGIRIDAISIRELHEYIHDVIRANAHEIVSNLNVHACNLAVKDQSLRAFFNSSGCVFCDGHGVMLGARLLGNKLPEKITYAHWFPLFCEYAEKEGISLFFLGGRPGVAELAKEKLLAQCPSLDIAGFRDGFFNKDVSSVENKGVIDEINRVKPNVLLVSFGMPLQEKWLSENWDKINANVALTGGAALDYMAGVSKRPPVWLTSVGFEWLGRMLYEPRRLWKRYVLGNPLFLFRVLHEAVRARCSLRTDDY